MKSSALILSSKTCRAVFLACGSSAFLWLALPANAGIALFDFDTGTPTLSTYQNLPLDQTSDGVTAHLTGNFSIQSDATIFKSLSQFSANYVYPNAAGGVLQIQFSAPLTRLNFNFATTDTHQIEYTTLLQLTAYRIRPARLQWGQRPLGEASEPTASPRAH